MKFGLEKGKSPGNLSESISRVTWSRGLRQSPKHRRFSITLRNIFQRDLTLSPKTSQQMSSHIKSYSFQTMTFYNNQTNKIGLERGKGRFKTRM